MKRSVFLATLVLAACGLAGAQTLTVGQSGLPATLDTGQDGNSNTPAYQILENLVAVDPATGELEPGLATEWSANEDSTMWTFELREGVAFQDGTPFDAEAVRFNFERWNDPEHPHRYGKDFVPWTWSFGGFAGSDEALLRSVRAVDEDTVEFELTQSISFLPAILASSYFGMHSPAAIEEAGADYGTPRYGVVGTGAFEFEEWVDGSQVVLTRSEDHWGDPAGVERLVFLGIEDPNARLAQLKSGALDIAVELSSDSLPAIESDPALTLAVPDANLNVGYLGFHQANEPFDDPRVRRAVAHAIDREAIVEAFYAGLGQVADQHVPPTLWGRAELDPYPYDPERARELLAEAGHPDGFQTELWYMPVSRPYFPAPEDIATTMATYLADVGIEAELLTVDWGTYLEDYDSGAFPMYMLGWTAEFADPDNFLYTFFGPSAPATLGWENPDAVELLTRARRISAQEERAALYAQVAERVHEQAIQLPVAHNRVLNATRNAVEGFVPAPFGTNLFTGVTLGGE